MTAKPSGSRTKTSSVAMASGVSAIQPRVLVSKRRCMKYIATSTAFVTASTPRSRLLVILPKGRKTTMSSRMVRTARYQKIAMWLGPLCSAAAMIASSLKEVHEGEDHDPDEIDEVPV